MIPSIPVDIRWYFIVQPHGFSILRLEFWGITFLQVFNKFPTDYTMIYLLGCIYEYHYKPQHGRYATEIRAEDIPVISLTEFPLDKPHRWFVCYSVEVSVIWHFLFQHSLTTYYHSCYHYTGTLCRGRIGKVIPVTGRGGPLACETSRLPHLPENRLTDGGEVDGP
jgi:hypothetical protein